MPFKDKEQKKTYQRKYMRPYMQRRRAKTPQPPTERVIIEQVIEYNEELNTSIVAQWSLRQQSELLYPDCDWTDDLLADL